MGLVWGWTECPALSHLEAPVQLLILSHPNDRQWDRMRLPSASHTSGLSPHITSHPSVPTGIGFDFPGCPTLSCLVADFHPIPVSHLEWGGTAWGVPCNPTQWPQSQLLIPSYCTTWDGVGRPRPSHSIHPGGLSQLPIPSQCPKYDGVRLHRASHTIMPGGLSPNWKTALRVTVF